jgi:hypothetical protein
MNRQPPPPRQTGPPPGVPKIGTVPNQRLPIPRANIPPAKAPVVNSNPFGSNDKKALQPFTPKEEEPTETQPEITQEPQGDAVPPQKHIEPTEYKPPVVKTPPPLKSTIPPMVKSSQPAEEILAFEKLSPSLEVPAEMPPLDPHNSKADDYEGAKYEKINEPLKALRQFQETFKQKIEYNNLNAQGESSDSLKEGRNEGEETPESRDIRDIRDTPHGTSSPEAERNDNRETPFKGDDADESFSNNAPPVEFITINKENMDKAKDYHMESMMTDTSKFDNELNENDNLEEEAERLRQPTPPPPKKIQNQEHFHVPPKVEPKTTPFGSSRIDTKPHKAEHIEEVHKPEPKKVEQEHKAHPFDKRVEHKIENKAHVPFFGQAGPVFKEEDAFNQEILEKMEKIVTDDVIAQEIELKVRCEQLQIELDKERIMNQIMKKELHQFKERNAELEVNFTDTKHQLEASKTKDKLAGSSNRNKEIEILKVALQKSESENQSMKDHLNDKFTENAKYQEETEQLIQQLQDESQRLRENMQNKRKELQDDEVIQYQLVKERCSLLENDNKRLNDLIKTIQTQVEDKNEIYEKLIKMKSGYEDIFNSIHEVAAKSSGAEVNSKAKAQSPHTAPLNKQAPPSQHPTEEKNQVAKEVPKQSQVAPPNAFRPPVVTHNVSKQPQVVQPNVYKPPFVTHEVPKPMQPNVFRPPVAIQNKPPTQTGGLVDSHTPPLSKSPAEVKSPGMNKQEDHHEEKKESPTIRSSVEISNDKVFSIENTENALNLNVTNGGTAEKNHKVINDFEDTPPKFMSAQDTDNTDEPQNEIIPSKEEIAPPTEIQKPPTATVEPSPTLLTQPGAYRGIPAAKKQSKAPINKPLMNSFAPGFFGGSNEESTFIIGSSQSAPSFVNKQQPPIETEDDKKSTPKRSQNPSGDNTPTKDQAFGFNFTKQTESPANHSAQTKTIHNLTKPNKPVISKIDFASNDGDDFFNNIVGNTQTVPKPTAPIVQKKPVPIVKKSNVGNNLMASFEPDVPNEEDSSRLEYQSQRRDSVSSLHSSASVKTEGDSKPASSRIVPMKKSLAPLPGKMFD